MTELPPNILRMVCSGYLDFDAFVSETQKKPQFFDDDTKWNLIASIHRHDYTFSELLKTIIISNLFRHKTYVMQIRMSGKTKPPFGSNHYHLTHSRRSHFQTFH